MVIACGNEALKILEAHKVAPKGRSINSLREKVLQAANSNIRFLVTHDPFILSNQPDKKPEAEWDVRLANRLHDTGFLGPKVGLYSWVKDFSALIARIKAKFLKTGLPVDLTLDLETMGFDPFAEGKEIISAFFTDRPGFAEGVYFGDMPCPVKPDASKLDELWEQINWLLTTEQVKLRGSNLKFDMRWIMHKWGIYCTNLKFDNCLAGSLLDENRSNSLNMHTKSYTDLGGYDDEFNSKYDKSHMELVNTDDMLTYAGGDVDAAHRVADVFREQLMENERQAQFYVTILNPASRAFEKVEYRGLAVDREKYAKLEHDLDIEIASLEQSLMDLIPKRIKMKHLEKIEASMAKGKTPLIAGVLQDFFFSPLGMNLKPLMTTAKKGDPSMTSAHLKMFGENPIAKAFVTLYDQLNSATKTQSTFVRGFLKHLCDDGYFHANYMLFHGDMFENSSDDDSGTVTGRLSCKSPAIQTIPKKTNWAKRIRECFICPPGKAMLMLDYSQGELRVVACVANETTMIESYQKGLDLHAVTGAQLGEVPLEEFLSWKDSSDQALQDRFDDLRGRAKPANFGLLYGMGVDGFIAYAWAAYGLKLSYAEATKIHGAFFSLYGGLPKYHDLMRKAAHMQGQVVSPLGRIRHLPHIKAYDKAVRSRAERQAINSPIQSALSDMMCWAIARIDEEFPDGEIAVVGMIHDALIAYVDADKVEHYAKQAREIMSNLPFKDLGWNPVLNFPADAEYSLESMAKMTKIKFAA